MASKNKSARSSFNYDKYHRLIRPDRGFSAHATRSLARQRFPERAGPFHFALIQRARRSCSSPLALSEFRDSTNKRHCRRPTGRRSYLICGDQFNSGTCFKFYSLSLSIKFYQKCRLRSYSS